MTAQSYEKLTERFRRKPETAKRIEKLNKILTVITYFAYIILVVSQLFLGTGLFWKVLLVPGVSFVLVTVFRKICNAKRPYELLDIRPLLSRRKSGQSFPSRHAFSIFMIAMALGYVWMPLGIVFLILGVLLAWIRVIGGVHFPRDVIAGAVVGVGLGILGFYVL